MPDARERGLPGVVSYVRRSPRMNPGQQRTLVRHASRYLIEEPRGDLSTSLASDAQVHWDVEFGHPTGTADSPVFVEIGSGTGDALLACALVLTYRAYQELGTVDTHLMRIAEPVAGGRSAGLGPEKEGAR